MAFGWWLVSNPNTQAFNAERQFILLGVLLQALHVLFGITAIFGMYLNHNRLPTMQSDLWRSHCRWQLTTFWMGAGFYVVSAFIGLSFGHWWPFILAAMWVSYRILSSAVGVATKQPIVRFNRLFGDVHQ